MDKTNQKRAQYATASALLFHFEDDDLRTENEKLRHALTSLAKNSKRAVANPMSKEEISGERPLDFTAVHPLHPKIVRLLRECSQRLRHLQSICAAFKRENADLRSRLKDPSSIAQWQAEENAKSASETRPATDALKSPPDDMLVDAIDSAIAASETVARPSGQEKPLSPSLNIQTAVPAPPAPVASPADSEVIISRISIGVQTGCNCARSEVALTGSELEFIRTRGEPERSKEWLSTMCVAADRSSSVSQKDLWLAYRSQCDGGRTEGGAAFDPVLFFNVLKELFPGTKMSKAGGDSKEPYRVSGLARKRQPCRCGAER